MAKKNGKDKLAQAKNINKNARSKLAWYVMVGYMLEDQDKTGCLAVDTSPGARCTYKFVGLNEAKRFPSQNVNKVKGFGTPQQWLEYFNSDPELEGWKFHLVKVAR